MRASKESRTHRRWREQVARLIALATTEKWQASARRAQLGAFIVDYLAGDHFDVAQVRSYAERIIAEGERLEAERVVFADWTRAHGREGITTPLGMGPECRDPHAFKPPAAWASGGKQCKCAGWAREIGQNERDFAAGRVAFLRHAKGCEHANVVGGWPGPLAREWGTVGCEACEGKGRVECSACVGHPGGSGRGALRASPCHSCNGYLVRRCGPCRGRGYVKHPKREAAAANGGAWMIRAGRRLLDTLDGRCPWAPSAAAQPSECQRCWGTGHGYPVVRGPFEDGWRVVFDVQQAECPDCRGTGHSLSGTLPPVEWSAQTRRKAADGLDDEDDESTVVTAWTSAVGDVVELKREWPRTRVVPRGQHRTLTQAEARAYGVQAWRGDEPSEWAARAVAHALDRDPDKTLAEMRERHALGMKHLPRWRRGELRHSEQRRERERRRAGTEVDRFRETNARLRDLLQPSPDL